VSIRGVRIGAKQFTGGKIRRYAMADGLSPLNVAARI